MKTNHKTILAVCGVLIAVALCVYLIPARFAGEQLRAQVVDADLIPVAGAEVEVVWRAWASTGNMCNAEDRTVHTYRAVTDDDGYFVIPKWGSVYLSRRFTIDSADPHVVIRKTNYEDRLIGGLRPEDAPSFSKSRLGATWNGKRIALALKGKYDPSRIQGLDPY